VIHRLRNYGEGTGSIGLAYATFGVFFFFFNENLLLFFFFLNRKSATCGWLCGCGSVGLWVRCGSVVSSNLFLDEN
jgi:hypothetical protein